MNFALSSFNSRYIKDKSKWAADKNILQLETTPTFKHDEIELENERNIKFYNSKANHKIIGV
jgi:hypothetical protein